MLLATAGCSEPPQKEIDQAQAAIETARAAGAEQYASDEFAGATATLQKARASVDERDYRQALSYALDARQRALEAARVVDETRTRARTDAEAGYKSAADRAGQLQTQLREGETARAPVQELRASQEALAHARTSLQEARSLLDAGNFTAAATKLAEVRENLDLAAKSMPPIPQRAKPVRRRD